MPEDNGTLEMPMKHKTLELHFDFGSPVACLAYTLAPRMMGTV